MAHFGVICPNTPGLVNPMLALANAIRHEGHRVSFCLLGDLAASVHERWFDILSPGRNVSPADEYHRAIQTLGVLEGRAPFRHTLATLSPNLRQAITRVLDNPSYRTATTGFRDSIDPERGTAEAAQMTYRQINLYSIIKKKLVLTKGWSESYSSLHRLRPIPRFAHRPL